MVKTRKNRSFKMKMHTDVCCEATMHGLHKWYESAFEKLGWMILAESRGNNDKITMYKMELNHLCSALEHKRTKHVREHDRKEDLQIMQHNVELLIAHVNKDFPSI